MPLVLSKGLFLVCSTKKMCMKKLFLCLWILLLFGCSPATKIILSSQAFYSEQTAGTVRADEYGNEVQKKTDTVFVVFIETSNNKVSIDSAWYKGRAFAVEATQIPQRQFEAGLEKGSLSQTVIVTARESAFLFRLQLKPVAVAVPPKPLESDSLLIRIKTANRFRYHLAKGFQELTPFPSN